MPKSVWQISSREPQCAVGNEEITIETRKESNLLASEVIECTFLVEAKASEILLVFNETFVGNLIFILEDEAI